MSNTNWFFFHFLWEIVLSNLIFASSGNWLPVIYSVLILGGCAPVGPALRIIKQTIKADTLAVPCLLVYIQKNGDE